MFFHTVSLLRRSDWFSFFSLSLSLSLSHFRFFLHSKSIRRRRRKIKRWAVKFCSLCLCALLVAPVVLHPRIDQPPTITPSVDLDKPSPSSKRKINERIFSIKTSMGSYLLFVNGENFSRCKCNLTWRRTYLSRGRSFRSRLQRRICRRRWKSRRSFRREISAKNFLSPLKSNLDRWKRRGKWLTTSNQNDKSLHDQWNTRDRTNRRNEWYLRIAIATFFIIDKIFIGVVFADERTSISWWLIRIWIQNGNDVHYRIIALTQIF